MGLCACTLTYRLNESVDGLQAAMIADNLESSEDYYAGRGVSAVIVDEHPMADLDDEKQPELRDGHSGIGWYNKDDLRIDMGDPDDP